MNDILPSTASADVATAQLSRTALEAAIGRLSIEPLIVPGVRATQLCVLECGGALYLSRDGILVVVQAGSRPEWLRARPYRGRPAEAWAALQERHNVLLGVNCRRFWTVREAVDPRAGAPAYALLDLATMNVLARATDACTIAEWGREAEADPERFLRALAIGEVALGLRAGAGWPMADAELEADLAYLHAAA